MAPAGEDLAQAARARKAAEKTLASAQKAALDAGKQIERIKCDVTEDERTRTRLCGEFSALQSDCAIAEQELATALRGPVPQDPEATVDERITLLKALTLAEQTAAAKHTKAKQTHAELVHAGELLRERLVHYREQL